MNEGKTSNFAGYLHPKEDISECNLCEFITRVLMMFWINGRLK